jgi:putative DNA primase/helicase
LCKRVKEEFDRQNLLAIQAWEAAGRVDEHGNPVPQPVARKVTTRLVGDCLQALTGLALLPSDTEEPSWLKLRGADIERHNPSEIIVCSNGIGHLSALATDGVLEACTPSFFSRNALDYAFDPQAPPPRFWLEFLGQLWPKDVEAIRALQEFFGYLLTGDTRLQKILMLVGPRRSGKGTIARVLRALIGLCNVCSPTLASLATNFGMWPLLGRTVAIISDARLSGRTDVAVIVERLLSVSGEDAQTIDRKHLPPVTTKLAVRFVILTNELPKLSDPSGALAGRLILLRLVTSFYGQEDTALTDRLLTELPGILLWSIEGWLRLQQRGYYLQPKSGQELIEDMEDLASPIGAFVRERCEVGPVFEVFVRDIFAAWKFWCEEKGRKEPGHEHLFGRDLHALLPALEVRQPREGDKRFRVYVGIRLRQDGQVLGD